MSFPKLLDKIQEPKDFRGFNVQQLDQLAQEVREAVIESVSSTGGHLGAGLGVVELTVALHYVFNTPRDKIIWDVGHQSYPHKILTGRKSQMHTLRKEGGLAGFTKRSESIYDPFGAGHSSTSISAGLGMAVARDQNGDDFEVIAIIGDGAMSAGMAYEAMNNAGAINSRMIVILNDNDMSIAPPVGAMSNYLSRLISSRPYLNLRTMAKSMIRHLPRPLEKAAKSAEKYARNFANGGNFFEEMGFYYVGPIDGHNIHHLLPILKNIRDDRSIEHPILIHVVTEKGKGFKSPEASKEKYHAVNSFDLQTKLQTKNKASTPTYTQVFAQSLIDEAAKDTRIIAITAAMPSGTGLDKFASKFPDRMFDVGIAEQHAVTFAAGLACEGLKPFCAIYSTFLQRAYDQVVHDVAIQNLPVRFAIDRAGLVGADGPTHAGSFDITYLATLPNMVVMAPSDEVELCHMVATAAAYDSGPIAFRYPRGEGRGLELPAQGEKLEIGKGRIVQKGSDVAILSLGTRLSEALKAAEEFEQSHVRITVADARFVKPLDEALILSLYREHRMLIIVEDGSIGGFSSHVMDLLAQKTSLSEGKIIRTLHLPDSFIDHASQTVMLEQSHLNAKGIVAEILQSDIFASGERLVGSL